MTRTQIENLIEDYIKNNLKIEIKCEKLTSYEESSSTEVKVTTILKLNQREIHSSNDTFYVPKN